MAMPLRPCGAGSRPAGVCTHEPVATRPVRRSLAPIDVPAAASPRARASAGPDASAGTVGVSQGPRLAVDVGSVRVGVARSDPGGILASPLAVIRSGPDEL